VNRLVTTLLLVLIVQIGIITYAFWPGQTTMNSSTRHTLAPFARDAIDELRIGDQFDNEVVLLKLGEQWLLPNLEGLPADPARVETLLRSITAQKNSWPVARSPASRQRFQVVDYYYQRRLSLLSGGEQLGVIFLGTSPGFRKVHARNEKQDDIYSIPVNTFDIPAISGDWLDPRLLQVRAPLQIDADLYNLRFENGVWLTGTGGIPDERELEALVTGLKTLQVDGVADEDLQRELSAVEADLVLKIRSLAGEATLELLTLNGENFIHSTEYPLFFKLSAYDFDRLTGIDFQLISGELLRQ
jgi:hypothetical protein